MRITRRTFIGRFAAAVSASVAASSILGQTITSGAEEALTNLSLREASELIRRRAVSPVELTKACLSRIERLNPALNAFITVTTEEALQQAHEAESEIQRGHWRGALHGIPIGLKDNIDTAGIKTTAASRVFADRVPKEDAQLVNHLRAAGAVLLGKHNMHEFSFGTTSVISYYGPVHNPWKLDCIAGGSSGGSAAAVAAGLCYGAVGTDTGASIRAPAACCGIVGLKPTLGLVNSRGLVFVSQSFDTIGPLCRTVVDAAILLSTIAGSDRDYTSIFGQKPSRMRIGFVLSSLCDEKPDAEVDAAVRRAVSVLADLGNDVRELHLARPADLPVIAAEAYANHEQLLRTGARLYDPRTRRELQQRRSITASAYIRGLRELERLRTNADSVLSGFDLLVTPTLPHLPGTIVKTVDPFALKACTYPFNVYGLPAISIPCGFSRSGLPIGMQLIGKRFNETAVLGLAHAYEQATEWHKRRPAL
ncbi:MAG: amidase [Acidobacteriales bacterium]|nr:amidase [Terriglobales bacterium]